MFLLQNDLFYLDDVFGTGIIQYEDLIKLNNEELLKRTRYSRLVVLGGLGFSGCNETFNANNGIYRDTIDREQEIEESIKIDKLYKKLNSLFVKRNTIIFTHTSFNDWCQGEAYNEDYIYVSGHNHRNYFYDDGKIKIYADNQIGYRNEKPHLKSFFINNLYDSFDDYEDNNIYGAPVRCILNS